jgi:hypothetical protein
VAAGEEPGVGAQAREQVERVLDAGGTLVVERGRNLQGALLSS